MCTVTYLSLGNNDFILTSNRDEDPKRKTISPTFYDENGAKLIYPKDEIAGGTWIGLSDKKRLVCLLNGGFTIHEREVSYKMSRGIIVKKLLTVENGVDFISNFDFNGIEPFTIIYLDWKQDLKTYELVWDGDTRHFSELDKKPKIWSSSTLYSDEMKEIRKNWFKDWLKNQQEFQQSEIVKFHQTENENSEIALKMKRAYVGTISITSVNKNGKYIGMEYLDLVTNKITQVSL